MTRLEKRNEEIKSIEEVKLGYVDDIIRTIKNGRNVISAVDGKNFVKNIIKAIENLQKFELVILKNNNDTNYDLRIDKQSANGIVDVGIGNTARVEIAKRISIEITEAITAEEVLKLQKQAFDKLDIATKLTLLKDLMIEYENGLDNLINYWNEEI